jgi:thiamine-monophosphate kinase
LGIGDDAAVINPEGKRVVVSTDMLVEGVHFDLSYAPLKHLGYKAVAVNLSDICAMNSLPTQVTVSIAVSSRFSVEALDELYTGVHKACAVYGVDLVGGDTSSSTSGLMITVTALGLVDGDQAVSRSGARAGDLLVVTGDLGGAYMGLQVLEREKVVFQSAPTAQPDLSGHEGILERQLKPEARTDVIRELADLGLKPTSMIDISDGLASEVFHLCASSGLGVKLYEEKLPIDPHTYKTARDFNLDPTLCVRGLRTALHDFPGRLRQGAQPPQIVCDWPHARGRRRKNAGHQKRSRNATQGPGLGRHPEIKRRRGVVSDVWNRRRIRHQ